MLVKFLEQFGIYMFINSLLITSQLRWAQKNHFSDIELRITMSFVVSIIFFYAIIKILAIKKINSSNVSFALSFSILGIYLNSNQEIVAIVIIIALIYFLKKNKNNSIYENFWGHDDYRINFISELCNLQINNNSKKSVNVFKIKYLLTEIINCIIYCKGNKLSRITLESDEPKIINDIVAKLFNYFDIDVEIVKTV